MRTQKHLTLFIARLAVLLVGLILAAPLTGNAQSQHNGLGIAAVINDEVISVLDLESRLSLVIVSSGMDASPQTRDRVRPQVLRMLIDEKLMKQEATRVGIQVEQSDIKKALQRIASGNKVTVEHMIQNLKNMHLPLNTLTSRIEANIGWNIFVMQDLARTITIGEEETSDEIKRIQDNAGKPEYLMAEIFLPVDASAHDGEMKTLAYRLLQELKNGARFKTLATNFSRAPTAALGGDMGWVQLNDLDRALQKATRTLKPGQISIPVRALGGYFLLYLRAVRNSPGLVSGDTFLKMSQLHIRASNPKDPTEQAALAQHLITITRGMTTCAQLEAAGAKSGSPLSGAMGEIALSTMPPNMQATVGSLAIGQPSTPIPTGGGLAVMMVCARKSDALDMDKVRENIALALKARRLKIAAKRHLHNLRRDAFVDIRL